MMRSLFSGVSGLKTHQTRMDVIGNNIANVNTVAYKAASVTFNDLLSQTTANASGANVEKGTGGVNARQIGLGVRVGAINTNITGQGSSQSTGNPFDIMINGENFFIVSNGTQTMFTREGSFYVDGAGNLAMTSTGYNVMGWGVDEETGYIKQDTVTALRIMNVANLTYPPEATSDAYMAGIVDKNDTDVTSSSGKNVNLTFYDALGYSYTAKFVIKQTYNEADPTHPTDYSIELSRLLDSNGDDLDISGVTFGELRYQAKPTTLTLDTGAYVWNGSQLYAASDDTFTNPLADLNNLDDEGIANIAKAYGYEGSVDDFLALTNPDRDADGNAIAPYTTVEGMLNDGTFPITDANGDPVTSIEMDGRMFQGTMINFNPDNGNFAGLNGNVLANTAVLNLSALGGNFSNITVNLSELSNVDNKGTSTASATTGSLDSGGIEGAGRRVGDMIGITIQNNGMIYATYDNGMTRLLGQIATASFANASGLEKLGDNLYAASLNSGDFDGVGVDVTANGGSMSSGMLEMSNVDLSQEFTDMIITQRGFQANSRIITVSDTLLEELTNLKR